MHYHYAFPAKFPNSISFCNHIKALKALDKTKNDIIAQFQPAFTEPGCFIYCFKLGQDAHHQVEDCKVLKNIFAPYFLATSCRITNTTTNNAPTSRLCYNTGTHPYHLCSDCSLFITYKPHPTPTSILLGDKL